MLLTIALELLLHLVEGGGGAVEQVAVRVGVPQHRQNLEEGGTRDDGMPRCV